MSHARTPGSDIANGSLASLPARRRLARGDLEDDGSIGCADVSTACGIRDRTPLPLLRPRSSNDHRPARPQESAHPAREPNLHFSACSAYRRRRRSNQAARKVRQTPLPANLGTQQSGALMRCHLYHFNLLCSRTAGFFRSACGGTPVDCFRTARNWKRKSSNSRLGISATCFEVGNSADATAARKRERALARSSRTGLCSLARSPQACAWRGCFDESPQMSEAKRTTTSASPPE